MLHAPMIAFGCAITKPDEFSSYAAPGIDRAREPDSAVITVESDGSLFVAYNAILSRARQLRNLEALVLVHQDTEIASEDLCAKVRETFSEPDVAIIGCVGAVGVRSIAWWQGAITTASFSHRYNEFDGGEIDGFSWDPEHSAPYARYGEVDSVDGFLLVLSPWAVQHLSFDESLGRIHGYDLDICLQAREAGRSVVTADFRAIHHRSLWPISDPNDWAEANVRVVEKWEERMPDVGSGVGSWRDRKLRADAGADAATLTGHLLAVELEAVVSKLQADIRETASSISWRMTGPMRLVGARDKRRDSPDSRA